RDWSSDVCSSDLLKLTNEYKLLEDDTMITVSNVSLQFSDKKLFEDVNLKFNPGNCYGVIGANGAGKSTFLKILSGEIEPTQGHVSIDDDKRLAVLKQDQFAYEDEIVLETVLMGHEKLYQVLK